MNDKPQSYANHIRRQPGFHFFLIPILILNFLFITVYAVRHPSLASGWMVVLAIALLTLAFLSRMNAVTVQDRVIRLEERLRLARSYRNLYVLAFPSSRCANWQRYDLLPMKRYQGSWTRRFGRICRRGILRKRFRTGALIFYGCERG